MSAPRASGAADRPREASLAKLARAVRRHGGTVGLYLVVVDGGRARTLEALRAMSGVELPRLYEVASGAAGAAEFESVVRGLRGKREGVLVSDGDALVEYNGRQLIRTLNLQRGRLGDWIDGPLVIVVSAVALQTLAEEAADLYSTRVVSVSGLDEQMAPFASVPADARHVHQRPFETESEDSLRAEFEQLESQSEIADPSTAPALVDRWSTLAMRLWRLGRQRGDAQWAGLHALGTAAFRIAERLARSTGYAAGEAELSAWQALAADNPALVERAEAELDRLALFHLAATWSSRRAALVGNLGDCDRAVEILRSRTIPAFQTLGDARGEATARSVLAFNLARLARYEEAAIEIGSALPVLEQLGPLRFLCEALEIAATVAAHRGDLDHAIELIERRALAVAQELGDADHQADSHGLAAQYRLARGATGDASTARRHLDIALGIARKWHLDEAASQLESLRSQAFPVRPASGNRAERRLRLRSRSGAAPRVARRRK